MIDGESIQTSFARNPNTFGISKTKRLLTIVNNELALS
nr:MAG TPA: hypothetical protein [Bacteriophage sp.]